MILCMTLCILYVLGMKPLSTAEVQPRHLGRIAESMTKWEGQIADQLKLTEGDVAVIRTKYPRELNLQT